MKILWISFIGSWTYPLLNRIKQGYQVGLVIPAIGEKDNFVDKQQDITVFRIAMKKGECNRNMSISTFEKYEKIIRQFKPDIIHVHGTEKNLAQIQNYIKDIPIVISIQGILTGCKNFTSNYLDEAEIRKYVTLKNRLGRGGIRLMYNDICKGYIYETDILQNGKYFIGRTDWDKAHVMFHNPKAKYFHGEELLRDEFYLQAATWNVKQCQRHTIFMPSGFNPIKGLHHAIETVHLLKQYFDDIQLSVPGISPADFKKFTNRIWGEEYMVYCAYLIKKYGLNDHIKFLSRLNAKGMVHEMQKANVFLSPSSIDNSPNAVGEATMIGTPVVTTPVGGVPSMLTDRKEALFAPAGDPYMMALQIKQIFDDDELAQSLSREAHQVALKRHDREKTTAQYLNIYKHIIQNA